MSTEESDVVIFRGYGFFGMVCPVCGWKEVTLSSNSVERLVQEHRSVVHPELIDGGDEVVS